MTDHYGRLMWIILSLCCMMIACDDVESSSRTITFTSGADSSCAIDIQGTVFTKNNGTATISGIVNFPTEVEDGLTINMMFKQEGYPGEVGLVPSSFNCFEGSKTKGSSFSYRVDQLEAGTYQLTLLLKNENDEEVYRSTSEDILEINDGDRTTQDFTFLSL